MAIPRIESYHFGEIVIEGKYYSNDVIIYPTRVEGTGGARKGIRLRRRILGTCCKRRPTFW